MRKISRFAVAVVLGLGLGTVFSDAFADLAGLHGSDAAGFDFEAEMNAYGNPTPTTNPSVNPSSASNTHWGVHKDTGAMEKLTKKGNRFYDQAGNKISASGENIKTYKFEDLNKANKYAEKISAQKLNGSAANTGNKLPVPANNNLPAPTSSNLPAPTGGNKLPVKYTSSGGTNPTPPVPDKITDPSRMLEYKPNNGSTGGATPKTVTNEPITGPEPPAAPKAGITAGQALQVGQGLAMEYAGLKVVESAFMEEGQVDAGGVIQGAAGGAMAASGIAMALNAIPVAGQIGYGVAIGAGAVLGGGLMLTRVASQGDCVQSKIYPQWTHCCNVTDGNAALMGAYTENLAIGYAIHNDEFPYINYCGQKDLIGSGTYKTYQGKHKNDEWLDREVRWCPGYNWPAEGAHYEPVAFWDKENGHTVPCWKWRCVDAGMKWENNDCVPDPNGSGDGGAGDDPKQSRKTCNDLYAGHPKRLACCKAGKTTKWSNPNDLDGDHCYCVDVETQQPDNTKVWNGAKCVAAEEETDCIYVFKGEAKCANGNTIQANTSLKLSKVDLNGASCDKFKSLMDSDKNKFMEIVNKYCPEPEEKPVQTDFTKENAARDKLEAFFKKVDGDRSVWKNADGSFNAARLASDLTAGVVLGTVGGVVSGVLIKKSQVEKGFDALNCTINGQKVADWGDEFSVKFRM